MNTIIRIVRVPDRFVRYFTFWVFLLSKLVALTPNFACTHILLYV